MYSTNLGLFSKLIAITLFVLTVQCARAADEPESIKGDEKEIGDVKFARLDLPAKDIVPQLVWADEKGSAFYAITNVGVLYKVSFPGFEIKAKHDLAKKCSWLALSKEGLVVTLPDMQEVWLLDPLKFFTVKAKIAVPNVQRAVSAPGISYAVAGSSGQFSGGALHHVDLLTRKASVIVIAPDPDNPRALIGKDRPVISPDGKYLFTEGFEQICRYSFARGKWKFEETSPRIASGAIRSGIVVSPDSKFVCLPSGGGNYTAGYSTFVYSTSSLKKQKFTLEQGAYPGCVGFDVKGGYIYTQNVENSLIIFNSEGLKKKEYKVGPGGLSVNQYLIHPTGNKLLLFTYDWIYYVETMPSN